MAKRSGLSDHSSFRAFTVTLRFCLLPFFGVLIDSIVTTHFTLRSLPLISIAWIVHGYIGGAFVVQKADKKDEEMKPVVSEVNTIEEVKMVESIVEHLPEELRRRSTAPVVR